MKKKKKKILIVWKKRKKELSNLPVRYDDLNSNFATVGICSACDSITIYHLPSV